MANGLFLRAVKVAARRSKRSPRQDADQQALFQGAGFGRTRELL